jgi:thiol-disulfide isomerase/thioredoxin
MTALTRPDMRRFVLLAVLLATVSPAWADETWSNFVLEEPPKPLPDIRFQDAAAKPLELAGFRGKVVLLNLWATWCIPCRAEMPTLDRLQAKLGGADFVVVALSIDRKGMTAVESFYREVGIVHLGKYIDSGAEATGHLGILGLPTTLLIDREGRELGRLVGPSAWDSPEMVTFLQGIIAPKPAP